MKFKKCKNCKHWNRHGGGKMIMCAKEKGLWTDYDTGDCYLLGINEDNHIVKDVEIEFKDLSTHQDFGCVHFEAKEKNE